MDCQECREKLYPTDPRVAQYHKGKRYPPLCETCGAYVAEELRLEERVSNLEAITAEPGGIPRWYHDQILQLRNELAYWRKQFAQLRPAPPQAAHTKRGKPTQRSTYRGLTSEC